jgi:hypothetical protein
MEMIKMQRGNPVPKRGDGRRKEGLHTIAAKGEGAQYLSINGKQIQVTISEEHKAEDWVFTAVHLTV